MDAQPRNLDDLTDGFELIDARPYGEAGPPHASLAALRQRSPLHDCRPPGYAPFWAVTKHADVFAVSNRPDVFLNGPGIVHPRDDVQVDRSAGVGAMRTIIEMDPPQHRSFRKVASPWFTPRALARMEAVAEQSARGLVDALAARGREAQCDFA